jgi:hypothetical protein
MHIFGSSRSDCSLRIGSSATYYGLCCFGAYVKRECRLLPCPIRWLNYYHFLVPEFSVADSGSSKVDVSDVRYEP